MFAGARRMYDSSWCSFMHLMTRSDVSDKTMDSFALESPSNASTHILRKPWVWAQGASDRLCGISRVKPKQATLLFVGLLGSPRFHLHPHPHPPRSLLALTRLTAYDKNAVGRGLLLLFAMESTLNFAHVLPSTVWLHQRGVHVSFRLPTDRRILNMSCSKASKRE